MNPIPFLHPVPITIVGVMKENGKANFTTIGDVAVAGLNPPLLMISLHERHLVRQRLDETNVCTIHVPLLEHMSKVDYCGMHSGNDKDKDCLFEYSVHPSGAPVIQGMPFCMVCKLRERIQVEKRVIYVLDVIETIMDDSVKSHGIASIKTLMYGLDNFYYSSGERIGTGYHEGNHISNGEDN